jgi:hypothetical protein
MRRNMVQRMVFTWEWGEGADGGGKAEGPMPEILITVEFRQNKEGAATHI